MAHLNTPDVKSDRFENKLITHQKICPVAGAYAAPTQKGTADADFAAPTRQRSPRAGFTKLITVQAGGVYVL